jgi:hypothetical protein
MHQKQNRLPDGAASRFEVVNSRHTVSCSASGQPGLARAPGAIDGAFVHDGPSEPVTELYIDRFGRLHSADILTSWSQRALEAMRVRPVDTNPWKEAPSSTVS